MLADKVITNCVFVIGEYESFQNIRSSF